MHHAQHRANALTRARLERFTDGLMQFGRLVLVLIGIVLVERAYVRAGG
jgi:hypothetical protein